MVAGGPTWGSGEWVTAHPGDGRQLNWRLTSTFGIESRTIWPDGSDSGWQDFSTLGAGNLPGNVSAKTLYGPSYAEDRPTVTVLLVSGSDQRFYRTVQLRDGDLWTPWGDITDTFPRSGTSTQEGNEPDWEGEIPGNEAELELPGDDVHEIPVLREGDEWREQTPS